MIFIATVVSLCALVSACGGGQDASPNGVASPDSWRDTELAQRVAAPAWGTTVAAQNETFTLATRTPTRYGAGNKWVYRWVTGKGFCTAAFFGRDPAPTALKHCEVQVAAAVSPAPVAVIAPVPAQPSPNLNVVGANYVTVEGGHLFRGGKRLRQWGVNLQSGVFTTYSEIDLLIPRLRSLGFNALRLWPTSGTFYASGPLGSVPASAVKGDGSALDRYDYLIYKATEAGMTLQMTALHYLDLPSVRGFKAPAVSNWVASARSDAELRLLLGFAPYVSDEYRQFLKEHIARQLQRVNPYTNTRYANLAAASAWELANESRFVDCSLAASCVQGLPRLAFESLSSRWQASTFNTSSQPLPGDMVSFIAGPQYPGYARFVASTFIAASDDMRTHARAAGGAGSGIAVQPVIFNTGPIAPNAVAHFAYSQGDVFSIGSYRSPLQQSGSLDGSAWLPAVVSGKMPGYLNHVKVEGKPMIIYETSFFRPYAYRSEWGPLMAAMALQQDWDGVFLYQYGHPSDIYSAGGKSEGYGTMVLPEPSAHSPNEWKRDYTYGFHHGGDPTVMGSWSIAGRLFTTTQESPPLRRSWRLPLNAVFARPGGYPAGYFEAASSAAKSGSVAMKFVVDDIDACSPCALSDVEPREFNVSWPTALRPSLVIQAPGGKAIAGLLSGDIGSMSDEFGARVTTPGFGIAAVLRDTDSLGRHVGNTLQVVGNVLNSGMSFDRNLVHYDSPIGAIFGLVQQGTAPLIYQGLTVEFKLPNEMSVLAEDFTLRASGSPVRPALVTFAAQVGTFRLHVTP